MTQRQVVPDEKFITIAEFRQSRGVGLSRIGLPTLPMILLKSISSATISSTGSTQEGRGCKPKEHFGLRTTTLWRLFLVHYIKDQVTGEYRQFSIHTHNPSWEAEALNKHRARWPHMAECS